MYKLFTPHKIDSETPDPVSLTVPDQSLSVQDILDRHVRGQRTPDKLIGYYDEENDPLNLDGTNIETLDLSEKYDLMRAHGERLRDHKRNIEKHNETIRNNRLKEQLRKEIEDTPGNNNP